MSLNQGIIMMLHKGKDGFYDFFRMSTELDSTFIS